MARRKDSRGKQKPRAGGAPARKRRAAKAAKAPSRLEDARARMYHDLVFEAAEHVFGSRGFDGATMQEIASEAGISLKTLYATFPGKRELYDEIMRERAKAFVAYVREHMAPVEDPVERIEAGVRAYVRFLLAHQAWLRIHMRARVGWSFRPRDAESAEAWAAGLGDYADTLLEGMEAGCFHPGDPDELAALAQALMQAHVARAVEAGETRPEVVADQVLVHLRRLLCVPGSRSDPDDDDGAQRAATRAVA